MAKSNEKKFNMTICPLWSDKFGGFSGLVINDEIFDALQQLEKGGRLVIKTLKPESRKSEKSPHAYLEYISKEDVATIATRTAAPKSRSEDSSGLPF